MNGYTRAAALSAGILCLLSSLPVRAADDASARLIEELGLKESATALRDRPGWAPPKKVVLMGPDASHLAAMQAVAPGVTIVASPDPPAAVREAAAADALIGEC